MSDEAVANESTAPAAPRASGSGRGRRIAYWTVLVLTTVLATLSIFGVWASRQLLDTDNWTETSTKLLQNEAIRDQTAVFLTDQLYANVDVEAEIRDFLPENLQVLAAPAAGAVRNVVDDAADKALRNPTIQATWSEANRAAHEGLVNVIEDEGRYTSIQGDKVVLDLRPILVSIAARLGLPQAVQERIPASAGQVEVLRAEEISTAQSAAKLLKNADWFLRLLVVLGLGLSIWLARGRRAQALAAAGLALVIAGLSALIIRSITGGAVVDSLASTEAVRPAATAAWTIGTDLLETLAWSTVFVGLPAIAVGLLLGPYRWAQHARTRLAPLAHNRPEVLYGVAVLLVLLLVIWEPVPATRRLLPIAIFLAVFVGGAYALHRLTLEENPDPDAIPAGGPGLRERTASAAALLRPAKGAEPGDEAVDQLARLERLAALRDGGALTPEEFEAEKAKLLGPG